MGLALGFANVMGVYVLPPLLCVLILLESADMIVLPACNFLAYLAIIIECYRSKACKVSPDEHCRPW